MRAGSEIQVQPACMSGVSFPSPLPSPKGRRRIEVRLLEFPTRPVLPTDWLRFALSPGERTGGRGNGTRAWNGRFEPNRIIHRKSFGKTLAAGKRCRDIAGMPA